MRFKIFLPVTATVMFFALGTAAPTPLFATTSSADKDENTYRLLALFGDVFDKVKDDYVEDVTDQKLVESAINGMLTSLDPHSSYLNEESFKDMQVQTKGEFGGLGIEVTSDMGWIKIVSPIDDTPAFKAGIKAGDYITHLDGTAVLGLTLTEAVEKMRGKAGTKITLTIRREGSPDPIKVELVRAIIKINPVRYEAKTDDKVGYIRVNSFSEKTTANIKTAIKDIKAKLKDDLLGYVIDLRNNPGGLLDQAVSMTDLFLEGGEIVSTRSRSPEDTTRANATAGDITDGLPLVVIINEGSASASEIVAGALQDHRRAVIVGTKSFGKGSVQSVIPIIGHGAIRLTTARYYTPSGTSIQADGIQPDIEIRRAKIEEEKPIERISESELPNALINDAKKIEAKNKGKNPKISAATAKLQTLTDKQEDYQLARAIDILKGIAVYQQNENKVAPASKAPASEKQDKNDTKGKK